MGNQEFNKTPRRILADVEMDLVLVERDLSLIENFLKMARKRYDGEETDQSKMAISREIDIYENERIKLLTKQTNLTDEISSYPKT